MVREAAKWIKLGYCLQYHERQHVFYPVTKVWNLKFLNKIMPLTRVKMTQRQTSIQASRLATSKSVTINTAQKANPIFIYSSLWITLLVSQLRNITAHINDFPGKNLSDKPSKYFRASVSSSEVANFLTVNRTLEAYKLKQWQIIH